VWMWKCHTQFTRSILTSNKNTKTHSDENEKIKTQKDTLMRMQKLRHKSRHIHENAITQDPLNNGLKACDLKASPKIKSSKGVALIQQLIDHYNHS
jgi:hypothetical protein